VPNAAPPRSASIGSRQSPRDDAPRIFRAGKQRRERTGAKEIVTITPKQRAHLKSLAHHLKPVAFVGKEGITDSTIRSIEEALNTRELIKVKVLEAAPLHVREAGAELQERIEGAALVQTIGRIAVLYRRDPEKPQIELP